MKYTIFQFLLVDIWIRSNIISKLGKKLLQSYYKNKKLRQPFISKWGKRFFEVWQEHLFQRWANLFQSGSVFEVGHNGSNKKIHLPPEIFHKKRVLKNFTTSVLFFQFHHKKHFIVSVFIWILQNVSVQLF